MLIGARREGPRLAGDRWRTAVGRRPDSRPDDAGPGPARSIRPAHGPLPPPVDACVTEIAASAADAGCGTACDGGRCRSGHHDNAHAHTHTIHMQTCCDLRCRRHEQTIRLLLTQTVAAAFCIRSRKSLPCTANERPQCFTNVQLFI